MTSTDRAETGTTAGFVVDPARGREVYDLDRAYVFYSWSAQSRIHPLVLAGASGSYVWDYEGNRYLDFSSQMVNTNIGHQHPVVVEAIREQAARLCTIAPQHANDQRSEAARRIVGRSRFTEGAKVFFTNAGAEAVEHAVRMARLHTGRPKVLATYRSYHGATGTAINLTGDRAPLAERYRHRGSGAFLRALPLPLAVPLDLARGGVCARPRPPRPGDRPRGSLDHRGDHSRDGPGHVGDHASATGLPLRGARAVRPARDRVHRGRGDVRVRTMWRMVRCRPLGGHPRSDHLRQGSQLGIRTARRGGRRRTDRRDVRGASLPRGSDLLRASPRLRGCGRNDRLDGAGRDRRARRDDRFDRPRARARRPRCLPPCRRGRAGWVCSGRSSWSPTGTAKSRSPLTGPRARRWTSSPRRVERVACSRSPTTTASTSCRPAR